MGHSGIVAIPIPDDGPANFQLTKQTAADYDMEWEPSSGGEKGTVETDVDYQVKAGDTIINCNGDLDVTLMSILDDEKAAITITSGIGTVELLADASIQSPTTLTSGMSADLYFSRLQWFQR